MTIEQIQEQIEQREEALDELQRELGAIPGHIAAAVAAVDTKTVKELRGRQDDLLDSIYAEQAAVYQLGLDLIEAEKQAGEERRTELSTEAGKLQKQIDELRKQQAPLLAEAYKLTERGKFRTDKRRSIKRKLDELIAEETARVQRHNAPTVRALNLA